MFANRTTASLYVGFCTSRRTQINSKKKKKKRLRVDYFCSLFSDPFSFPFGLRVPTTLLGPSVSQYPWPSLAPSVFPFFELTMCDGPRTFHPIQITVKEIGSKQGAYILLTDSGGIGRLCTPCRIAHVK